MNLEFRIRGEGFCYYLFFLNLNYEFRMRGEGFCYYFSKGRYLFFFCYLYLLFHEEHAVRLRFNV